MTDLQIRQLNHSFGRGTANKEVLHNISLEVRRGEFICILGPSGSGKSTLLNLIAGLHKPQSGEIKVNGSVGFMFQDANLFPWLTVRQNVAFGPKMNGQESGSGEKINNLLEYIKLADYADAYPHELSGGMRQRVALARTLILDPGLLLMDEPFAALDPKTRESLYPDVVRIHREQKRTFMLVTHNVREAIYFADRILVLKGRPARITAEVKLDLPRPRNIKSKAGQAILTKLEDLL